MCAFKIFVKKEKANKAVTDKDILAQIAEKEFDMGPFATQMPQDCTIDMDNPK